MKASSSSSASACMSSSSPSLPVPGAVAFPAGCCALAARTASSSSASSSCRRARSACNASCKWATRFRVCSKPWIHVVLVLLQPAATASPLLCHVLFSPCQPRCMWDCGVKRVQHVFDVCATPATMYVYVTAYTHVLPMVAHVSHSEGFWRSMEETAKADMQPTAKSGGCRVTAKEGHSNAIHTSMSWQSPAQHSTAMHSRNAVVHLLA